MVTKTTNTSKTTTKKNTKKQVEVEPTSGIIAIDNGGHNTKIFADGMSEPIILSSKKAFGHDRLRGLSKYPEGTYNIKYKDNIYFTGALLDEGEAPLNPFITDKSQPYFIISILQACALYGFDVNKVVTCTPFLRFSIEEEEEIVKKLLGEHEITINDVTYNFVIDDVEVAPEVTPAFYVDMPEGKVHWLDIGSRTVGTATTVNDGENWRVIEKETVTLERLGVEQKRPNNITAYVSEITNNLTHIWDYDDRIIVLGGGSAKFPEIVEEMKTVFPNTEASENPMFLQVLGLYEYGVEVFTPSEEDEEEI